MFWKSLIGALTIGCSTTLSVIPTTMAIETGSIENFKSIDNEKTYDVSFEKISAINFYNFSAKSSVYRRFIFEKTDVIGASKLPDNFYNSNGIVRLYIASQTIWKQVANVYGFDENTDKEEVASIMFNTAIYNVSMTIVQASSSLPFDEWVIKSFSATFNV